MGLIVQKFGGTSVGNVERIKAAAKRVIQEVQKGNDVIVVVSAMGKTTDELLSLSNSISRDGAKRELDMLLTTGEQITISLLSMAIQEQGIPAMAFTGWQAGIETEAVFGNARIQQINDKRLVESIEKGIVPVVAGFQGMTSNGDITTLGRGGSDTTAVAIAAALEAERCDIYTDVTGVFTTDPRYIKNAWKLSSVTYDEMLELANLGAGIIHPRAVEFAKNYHIPIEIRSSITDEEGTIIQEEDEMEQNLIVKGVAFEDGITRITLIDLRNSHHSISTVFSILAEHRLNVDIIIGSATERGTTNLAFSIHTSDLEKTLAVLHEELDNMDYKEIQYESNLAKLSIVGSGMVSNPGVAAKMFDVLASHFIEIKMVSTSEIKVSTVVAEDKMIQGVEALHEAFLLSEESEKVQQL